MKHLDSTISLSENEKELHQDAIQLAIELLPGWSAISPSDIKVSKMSGGITNVLLKLSPPEGSGADEVALRVFGDKTEVLIDRERELRILHQLNDAGFGAPIVGTFANGRVEKFIPYRPLEVEDMAAPDMAPCIARRLAQLHAVQLDEPRQGQIFVLLKKWLKDARELRFECESKRKRFAAVDLGALEAEVRQTEAACGRLHSPLVCSHNDLLSGNIMVPFEQQQSQPGVQFIDFEYSCYMHRGFDWGNHFNEYAGFGCDYSRYPDAEQAALFLRSYLTEQNGAAPSDEQVDAAVQEANVFALVSHQFWGTWSLFQAAYSAIDFDYLEYADLRWGEYRKQKQHFLGAVEASRLEHP